MTMSNEPQNKLSQYERLQIDTSMKFNNLKVKTDFGVRNIKVDFISLPWSILESHFLTIMFPPAKVTARCLVIAETVKRYTDLHWFDTNKINEIHFTSNDAKF